MTVGIIFFKEQLALFIAIKKDDREYNTPSLFIYKKHFNKQKLIYFV